MISMTQLQKVLTSAFGAPYLPEGFVTAKFTKDKKELRITIGPRDLWINKNGKRTGSGMALCEDSPGAKALRQATR